MQRIAFLSLLDRYTANGDVNDVVRDASDNATHYKYDAFGQLIYTTYSDDSYEKFTCYKNANLTSRTNRAGDIDRAHPFTRVRFV